MADSNKVVDMDRSRHRKTHERKEQQVDRIRDRFSKALGIDAKPVSKGGLWKLKQKKKRKTDKPDPSGW